VHPIGDAQRTVQGIDAEQGAPIGNREWDQAEQRAPAVGNLEGLRRLRWGAWGRTFTSFEKR
jgi:hypothetical protein